VAPESPAFSVVIPTWNRGDLVRRAIDSVLAQTFGDFEVVVVDDGSTDDTKEVVVAIPDWRLRYMFQPNGGESAARNAGARVARGRYLIFLDSDDAVRPWWLERFWLALAGSESGIALCGQENIYLEDGSSSRWVPTPCGLDVEELVNHFEAGQVALRRELFLTIGGYRTEITYGQHTELAIRLFCASEPRLPPVIVPDALVVVYRRPPRERDYGSGRAESARYVLEHHPACREQVPHLWASYQTIVGVHLARANVLRKARRHFLAAIRSEPRQWRHLVRLAAASTPLVARYVWPQLP
jgi:glycosyltransferase involved in cell wall biosynthesis